QLTKMQVLLVYQLAVQNLMEPRLQDRNAPNVKSFGVVLDSTHCAWLCREDVKHEDIDGCEGR
ncbi:hypothetical protein GZ151_12860, partial [Staphylococcus aureus]|nr:hypothetical protein [Staphylococcus aureus]